MALLKEILLYDKHKDRIITAIEGTGDNLTEEDEAEGCVDYMMTSIYEQDGEEISLIDSGQMLTRDLIKGMTTEEIIERLADYWETNVQDITIIKEN
jgi:hypothetical protein